MIKDVPVRRFEIGASVFQGRIMLAEMGYRITEANQGCYRIWQPGKGSASAKIIRRKKLLQLIDDMRVANGLEPIQKRSA